ncbi:hypothetical protein [Streptomyces collinus]
MSAWCASSRSRISQRYGYPAVLTVIVVCALIYRALRRNRWL